MPTDPQPLTPAERAVLLERAVGGCNCPGCDAIRRLFATCAALEVDLRTTRAQYAAAVGGEAMYQQRWEAATAARDTACEAAEDARNAARYWEERSERHEKRAMALDTERDAAARVHEAVDVLLLLGATLGTCSQSGAMADAWQALAFQVAAWKEAPHAD